jgi:hypothetical protein
MTDPDNEITTAAEFDAALEDLLLTALDNNVDIWGAWEYRTNGRGVDLETMIVELENGTASD